MKKTFQTKLIENTSAIYTIFAIQLIHIKKQLHIDCFSFQVIIVLTQLEGSGGFSIAHRLTHRLANSQSLCDWGEPGGGSHIPELDFQTNGLHSPRLMT